MPPNWPSQRPVASKSDDRPLPNPRPTNPTPLSAPQEQQVRDIYYRRGREKCAEELKAFSECSSTRLISVLWACRDKRLRMNKCLLQYQTQDDFDAARAEWLAAAEERRREKQERQHRQEEVDRWHEAWWRGGIDGKMPASFHSPAAVAKPGLPRDRGERSERDGR